LLHIKASLETFAEFSFKDFGISEQEFYGYQSKYLDIYEERKNKDAAEPESILDQIDFEIELTVRDIVNYDYIIRLIAGLKNITSDKLREKKTEEILAIFDRDVRLRKKKELVRKFIEENLPRVATAENVEAAFSDFWESERAKIIHQIAKEENIDIENLQELIGEYLYTQRLPHDRNIVELLPQTPPILKRHSIIERIKQALANLIEVFKW